MIKIYLAPMEGVVDYVIRDLFTQVGGYDQCVTEFVRVTHQLLPAKIFYRYCPELLTGGRTRAGVPVYVQLLGGEPAVLAENAALVSELGAAGIDLNFGCPAKTVNRHDGGATLLKNPERLEKIISAVRSAVPAHIPVTAKVRLGFDHKEFVTDIAHAVVAGGANRLTVHARTKVDGYRPPAYWEYIAQMKSIVPVTFPIVANGEIWNVADYQRCVELSGCRDVALGRSAFACPDLAWQIKAAVYGQITYPPVSWLSLRDMWLPKFFAESRRFRGDAYAVSRLKQWSKYLGLSYPEAGQFFANVKREHSYFNAQAILNREVVAWPA